MASAGTDFVMAPGTVLLFDEDGIRRKHHVVRQPHPTRDSNDPLNWTFKRKALNMTPIMGITAIIFAQYSIVMVFWQLWVKDLNVTYQQVTIAQALGFMGTALGCVFFIPFAIKYGRRPVYIVSILVMAACALWMANMKTCWELYATQIITGLAGATNETIIANLFFVHQTGSANGLYMIMVMSGTFLAPVIVGYMVNNGNWRLPMWILFGFDLFFFLWFLCLYEETKYVPTFASQVPQTSETVSDAAENPKDDKCEVDVETQHTEALSRQETDIDHSIPLKTWRQRLALWTPTDENIWTTAWRPFSILVKYPVVAYTAVQYSFGLAWISIVGATISIVYPYTPYGFTPSGIGLMSLGAFIGCILGSVYGGLLSDISVLYLAKRNRGYYEPEMRLHILHLPVLCQAGGILMFGLTTARGMHWIYPSVGSAIFGFGLGSICDISLTLTIDCYRAMTGEAFVAIAFIRNLASIAFEFAITPWFNHSGIQGMYIVVAVLALVFASLHIPLLIWGKKIRVRTAGSYEKYVAYKGEARI